MMSLYDLTGVDPAIPLAMQGRGQGNHDQGEGSFYHCIWAGPYHLAIGVWGLELHIARIGMHACLLS